MPTIPAGRAPTPSRSPSTEAGLKTRNYERARLCGSLPRGVSPRAYRVRASDTGARDRIRDAIGRTCGR